MIALVLTLGLLAQSPLQPARACEPGMLHTSADPALLMRPQDWPAARARKLGELPKANLEIAVERRRDGCPAPLIVRYAVEGDGRAPRTPAR